MNGRSPNYLSPRFYGGTPPTRNHQLGGRQPLYLQPNSPYMSPRGSRMSSPRNGGSPDFIPLGISSPVNRARQNWSRGNNSSYSSQSSPPSSNSSPKFSPYRRQGSWGNFRGRCNFNNSNNSASNSPHISLYIDKECLEDPWAELEGKMNHLKGSANPVSTPEATVQLDSASDSSDSDDEGDDS